jgi:hypothetical protein
LLPSDIIGQKARSLRVPRASRRWRIALLDVMYGP